MTAVFLIIYLVLFAIVLVAISLGLRFFEGQRKKQVKGMLDVAAGAADMGQEARVLREFKPTGALVTFSQRFNVARNMERVIRQAGLDWTVPRLAVSMGIGAVVGALLGWRFPFLAFPQLSLVAGALALGALPYLYVLRARKKRMDAFEQQLPEALDFLARSMRAGHAFSISLEMLGEESPDPIGQEFRTLFNEQNLGAPIESALRSFAERVPLLDVRLFVSSVLLQKQTGGNLSEILVRLAYVIRERFRLKGQVKAASAHGRLTAAVLTILPVVLMGALLVIAPGYLQGMAKDPDGKWMIVGAICGQVAGYYVMRRIIDIKV